VPTAVTVKTAVAATLVVMLAGPVTMAGDTGRGEITATVSVTVPENAGTLPKLEVMKLSSPTKTYTEVFRSVVPDRVAVTCPETGS